MPRHRPACGAVVALLGALLGMGTALPARAQSAFDVTTTVFRESGGPLNMTVINPAVGAKGQIKDVASISAGWEADVVSGASVAVVDAPGGSEVDAVTSATKLDDFRQVVRGGFGLSGDVARIDASYSYGFESDYRSHGFSATASADLFDRNTTLALSYARGWDSVCDLLQPEAEKAVERQRLPTSDGCFKQGQGRVRQALDIHSLQGSLTQAWTPIFNTQLIVSTQLLHGFQANPYRAIWLGRSAAQEHHPEDRARYAVGLGARLWLRPIGGALQFFGRAYRDTWDVRSVSAELGYERNLGSLFRVRLRGRYYKQTGAAFYSDDYSLDPAGQYFTGDRELSPMHSWLAGGRIEYLPSGGEDGRVLGFLEALRIVIKADYLQYGFASFHYGTASVPNTRSLFGTLGINAAF